MEIFYGPGEIISYVSTVYHFSSYLQQIFHFAQSKEFLSKENSLTFIFGKLGIWREGAPITSKSADIAKAPSDVSKKVLKCQSFKSIDAFSQDY